jgi:hypothetical protein
MWTAWYATELPYNAGPYKFKGLPGLILEMVDETSNFKFTAIGLEQINGTDYRQVEPINDNKALLDITHDNFNNQLKAFDKLSIMEQINFGSTSTISIINSSGEDLSKQRSFNKRSEEKRVYIESE